MAQRLDFPARPTRAGPALLARLPRQARPQRHVEPTLDSGYQHLSHAGIPR